jgi:signal transduction histidine kinase/ActR/RegA family two-component response regulator
LEQQAESLQQSQRQLQRQQEELRQTNEELEEQTERLGVQKAEMEAKNREIEQARTTLADRAEQLAITSKYKSEFLANMSHELRTPLNSLLIMAKLLADNEPRNLDEKQLEFANTIHSAGSDLLSLINDILDMAKIESGKMTVEPSEMPISDVVQMAHRHFQPLAERKKLQFSIDVADDLPTRMTTDVKRLHQILRNLLSNAFKFTDAGSVTLKIAPAKLGWSSDQEALSRAESVIAFSVTDTGIGIAEDKIKIIFEPFHQADGGTSRKYGGTGLGLSISRNIARLLGGEIRVTSTPGQGSTFTLFMPRDYVAATTAPLASGQTTSEKRIDRPAEGLKAPPEALAPQATATTKAAPSIRQVHDSDPVLTGRTVLIVDDDERNLRALGSVLERYQMHVIRAENGQEAIDALRANDSVDAVLMDIMMPVMDGYLAMREIRVMEGYADLPIIALTAKAMKGDREACIEAGASDYLSKPIDPDQIVSLLRVWLYSRPTGTAERATLEACLA